MKDTLLGSAATKAGLNKIINSYFFSAKVLQDGGIIANRNGTGVLQNFCWRLEKKQFKFYQLAKPVQP